MTAGMIFIMTLTVFTPCHGQEKSVRQSSLDAFARGDYENAYEGFRELLAIYPKDPLYRYYSGVCLIRLERDPEGALLLLEKAQQGIAVGRTVPDDALFWLGRARQLAGRYEEAIISYNQYTERYGKKAARDLDIPGYLQQCQNRKGRITESSPKSIPVEKISVRSQSIVIKTGEPEERNPVQNLGVPENVPAEFDKILSEALDYQFKADSITKAAEGLKSNLEKLDYKSKTEQRAKIAETEKLAATYQNKADQKYNEAQVSMNVTSFSALKFTPPDTVPKKDSSVVSNSDVPVPVQKPAAAVKKDTVSVILADVFSIFEIKPAVSVPGNKIPVNATTPPGLVYRIQLGVFRNPVTMSYFKGISPVYGFRTAGTTNTAYYAGMFRRIADARKSMASVKQKGFRDAFIVAFSSGKQISIERAATLEKEWGKKPFIYASPQAPADTIPPELCFRVEVMRSAKPVKSDVLEDMKKIAGTRGFDSETAPKGPTIYLIGKFITYESALRYADLLVRNGYRDAKVVARLGKKEIPVEKAREIFEKIE